MATPKKETLLDWYRQMVLIRRFEERCAELYQQGLIGGFLHLYIGQEATGVGAVAALREQDHVITAYRDHGIALARGLDPKAVMAEMLGVALAALVILLVAFKAYERMSLRFVSWVTDRNMNLAIFMFALFIVPIVLILI